MDGCTCKPQTPVSGGIMMACQYGYCQESRCPECAGFLWGAGPVACKCQWPGGRGAFIRGLWYNDMYPRPVKGLKPSIPKGRRHRQKKQKHK